MAEAQLIGVSPRAEREKNSIPNYTYTHSIKVEVTEVTKVTSYLNNKY